MRRAREMPEVVGMPFLDLICCAFGGIVLLYILAPRADGAPDPVAKAMRYYIVEASGGGAAPHRLGMRLSGPGTESACWPPHACAGALWVSEPGETMGAVKNTDPMNCITVAVTVPYDPYALPDTIAVRLHAPGTDLDEALTLQRATGYRAKVADSGGSGGC